MSYIFFNPKIKKVNALGKISARADDKPGYFFKWPKTVDPSSQVLVLKGLSYGCSNEF